MKVKNPLISQKSLLSRLTAFLGPFGTVKIVFTSSLIWSILSWLGIELTQWFHKYWVEIRYESFVFFTKSNSVCLSASIVRWFQRFLLIRRLVSFKFLSLFDLTSFGSFQISPSYRICTWKIVQRKLKTKFTVLPMSP